ncbi:MAG: hypothetical protein CMF69_11670 [Magnetovibrio sp.]|nr:hypothetical protein [Magnetovibrio sp.]|tara:strand:- start:1464 stop:1829 length:366 start_codon:yes stop_codon:yes gene_type:complete
MSFVDVSSVVISEDGKKLLKEITFEGEEKYEKCAITMESFEKGEKIIILPCEHYFKKEEIMKWLEDHSAACPICRKKLPNYEKIEKVPSNRSILINNLINRIIDMEEENDLQAALYESFNT